MRKAIGIDLGGTSIYGGLISEEGEILKKVERVTPKDSKKSVLEALALTIDELMEEGVVGIGIGSPGCIDSDRGRVLEVGGNIIDWANTDIRGELSKTFKGVDIFVENDANLAGLCEKWLGAGKNLENFVMLTLGTGVGGAIYTDKAGILKGYNFNGGEVGHAILYPRGRQCNCGQKGCVDMYLSGPGIETSYFEKTGQQTRARQVFMNSLEEKEALQVVERFSQDLAIYMTSIKNLFDPQGIIIGGGVINSREFWWDMVLEHYKKECNTPDSLDIVPASFLNDAGMIGAGRMVFLRI